MTVATWEVAYLHKPAPAPTRDETDALNRLLLGLHACHLQDSPWHVRAALVQGTALVLDALDFQFRQGRQVATAVDRVLESGGGTGL